jgi:hypothetical protein
MARATRLGASTPRRRELSMFTQKRDAGVMGGQVTGTADRGCGVAVPSAASLLQTRQVADRPALSARDGD